jgi:hypothetical protein
VREHHLASGFGGSRRLAAPVTGQARAEFGASLVLTVSAALPGAAGVAAAGWRGWPGFSPVGGFA